MGKRLLLVEGKDDEHVVKHLCRDHGIIIRSATENLLNEDDPVAFSYGGIGELLAQVPIRLKESDLEGLAVVLDADESPQSRWSQLRDRLRHRTGHAEIPDLPAPQGTLVQLRIEDRMVRLGVWIMPDNRTPGMLEDFLLFLVPDNDRTLPHVDRFLAGIPATDRLFPDIARAKARIHSFLAVQKEPGKPLGLAITFRYLDAKQESVQPFMTWLTSVLLR